MGGTGLGLAIVKHLAAAMGGDFGVESASPKGTIFWLELATGSKSSLGGSQPPVEPARLAEKGPRTTP